jgi:hypothetical protein
MYKYILHITFNLLNIIVWILNIIYFKNITDQIYHNNSRTCDECVGDEGEASRKSEELDASI